MYFEGPLRPPNGLGRICSCRVTTAMAAPVTISTQDKPHRRPEGRRAMSPTREKDTESDRRTNRRLALLLGAETAAVTIAALVHLSANTPSGASASFQPSAAGIAESLIAGVLACATVALASGFARARPVALVSASFAIFGFAVGLFFTVRGADTPDLVFHAVMLPLFLLTLVVLLQLGNESIGPQRRSQRPRS